MTENMKAAITRSLLRNFSINENKKMVHMLQEDCGTKEGIFKTGDR